MYRNIAFRAIVLGGLFCLTPSFSQIPGAPYVNEDRPPEFASKEFCSQTKPGEALKKLIQGLQQEILKGLKRTTPHLPKGKGVNPLSFVEPFEGLVDYHSSVHGHWFLLSSARVLEDKSLRNQIIKRLHLNVLKKHHDALIKNPEWSLPYGRVWLLLLIRELERYFSSTDYSTDKVVREKAMKLLTQIRYEQEKVLISWLREPYLPKFYCIGGPESLYKDLDGKNSLGCRGDHFSAPLNLFLFQLSTSPYSKYNKERSRILEGLFDYSVERSYYEVPGIAWYKTKDWDFADPKILTQLLWGWAPKDRSHTFPHEDRFYYPHSPVLPKKGKTSVAKSHSVGLNLVLLWAQGVHVQKNKEDGAMCETFARNFVEFVEREDLWRGQSAHQFYTRSHWVPQFLWMALALARNDL